MTLQPTEHPRDAPRAGPACSVGHGRQKVHHLRSVQMSTGGSHDGQWHFVCVCCLERHEHD